MAAGVEGMHYEHFEAACAVQQQEEQGDLYRPPYSDFHGSNQPCLPCHHNWTGEFPLLAPVVRLGAGPPGCSFR